MPFLNHIKINPGNPQDPLGRYVYLSILKALKSASRTRSRLTKWGPQSQVGAPTQRRGPLAEGGPCAIGTLAPLPVRACPNVLKILLQLPYSHPTL